MVNGGVNNVPNWQNRQLIAQLAIAVAAVSQSACSAAERANANRAGAGEHRMRGTELAVLPDTPEAAGRELDRAGVRLAHLNAAHELAVDEADPRVALDLHS